ncbi:MAG: SDR family NAD(P)-dependent oxidoreductase [Pseudomonadota bacterium]
MKRRVLVTGASAGAGRAIATRFAKEGHDLFLAARRSSLLEDLKAELESAFGINVLIQVCDLRKQEDVLSLYKSASEADVSVMINNAGLGDWNFVWDLSLDKLNSMIDLNSRALAVLSTLFVRDKRDTDACLINVTSLAGYAIFGAAVPYSATKFFATVFTEGLIHDLRRVGSPMKVKVMTPGPIDTEFTSISLAETRLPALDAGEIRFHTPEDIANFTYQLYESDQPIGLVNLTDMTFTVRDVIHPSGSL